MNENNEQLQNDSLEISCGIIKNYFNGINSIEEVILTLMTIIQSIKKYYLFKFINYQLRQILFLIIEGSNDNKLKFKALDIFNKIKELILNMKPSEKKKEILNSINSISFFDIESKTMPYHWRQQHCFEENIFFSDLHLKTFIDQFFEGLEQDKKYSQFNSFIDQCAKYLQTEYEIPEDQPQTTAFSSRALYSLYLDKNPLFPNSNLNEKFLNQISKLRNLPPSALMIREKFMPPATFNTPCGLLTTTYQKTILEASLLSFSILPDELFHYISSLHETLFEELVRILYEKSLKKNSLASFRAEVEVGQEDIMPIIIFVLILSDIPNLPEIVDFFNEYTTQLQVNSKSGLYMANIATAFGAIMNWEFN